MLKDGIVIAAAQEERFTRKKHDPDFPVHAINFCLKTAGITSTELSAVAFYDKPLLKFDRLLETYLAFAPRGIKSFMKSMPLWLSSKLWISDEISKKLNYKGNILFPEHHESHAASAFFPSPFNSSAFLTMDGVGEWATTSFGIGKENKIEILAEQHFPHSLGLLYSAFTYFTGFKVNSGEYKVMGLAPYGEPKYVNQIYDKLIDLKDDGSFRMNMDYFNYCSGLTMTNDKFSLLFGGEPRVSESNLTQREMDLACSIQVVTEEIVIRTARHIKNETRENNLCLAGGVALNCVANGKLLRENIFDKIWIQPAAGDAGGAIGAAYLAYYSHFGKSAVSKSRDLQFGSYLGNKYNAEEIESYLNQNSIPFTKLTNYEVYNSVSDLLIEGKVIGWFSGRMEFGPRALGNRSIIGDARNSEMQKTMNLKIKFREGFRPFAPSVLAEEASNWFDINVESPYMLLTADVKKDKQLPVSEESKNYWGIEKLNVLRSEIPAVTHVDYSARLQTVNIDDNPRYHALISEFFRKTGCPVIVNTSFNVRGEPIVESPADAYKCFMRTHLDVLVLGNYLLKKDAQPEFAENENWKERYELD